MAGRQNLLPKLDMGAVKDKEKERTKFGASMKKLSASIKRGMTPRGSRTYSTDLGGEVCNVGVHQSYTQNSKINVIRCSHQSVCSSKQSRVEVRSDSVRIRWILHPLPLQLRSLNISDHAQPPVWPLEFGTRQ